VRIEAESELIAPRRDVWALLAEPHHLSDWWPGYRTIRPDRRGLAPGARWRVVRSAGVGLLRRPGGDGLVVIQVVDAPTAFSWHDVEQRFDATISIEGEGDRTHARVALEAAWWRVHVEGLRQAPRDALSRLHALCQTAAGL
jgi:uncharacterized protein YndB with AHSA1/START domain